MAVANNLMKNETKKLDLNPYLAREDVKKYISRAIGESNQERFISSIISAVQANPKLQECTNQSIVTAALLGEALKLSPSPQLGQFYLVPYKKKWKENGKWLEVMQAQFQLGYKGYIQLAIRSGQYKKLNVLSIKEGELVRFDPLNEEIEVNLIEDEEKRENTPTIGYYAMFEYVGGTYKKILYWSKQKMMAHADRYSKAFSISELKKLEAGEIPKEELYKYSSYWYEDFDGMAYKTMLRQLISKWGVMSIEFAKAYESDMAVLDENGNTIYVDNECISPDKIGEEQDKQEEEIPDSSKVNNDNVKAAEDTFFA